MKKVELINLTSTNISRFFDVIDYNCNITKSDDNGFKNNAISVKKMPSGYLFYLLMNSYFIFLV